MRIRFLKIILAISFVFMICACSNSDNVKKVGIIMPGNSSDRWFDEANELKKSVEGFGYNTRAEMSNGNQDELIEKMIQDEFDAIIISVENSTATNAEIKKAYTDSKIKIVAYDRPILNSDYVDAFVSFDSYEIGKLQAKTLIERLGADKGQKITAEIIGGSFYDDNATKLYNGVMEVLKPYIDNGTVTIPSGMTEKLDVLNKSWNRDDAKNAMSQRLEKSGNVIPDVVFCGSDKMVLGVRDVIGSDAKSLLIGQDCIDECVDIMNKNDKVYSVYKSSSALAETAAKVTDMLLGGKEKVESNGRYDNGVKQIVSYILEAEIVNKENIKEVIK